MTTAGAPTAPRSGLLTTRAALTLALALGAGGLSGAMLGAVGRFVYLAIVWPGLAALLTGLAVVFAMRRLRLPGALLGAALAGVGGAFAVLAMLAVSHDLTRADVMAETTRTRSLGGDALDAAVKEAMDALTGGPSQLAPVTLRLHQGVRLFGEVRLDLGVPGNGALLLCELLIAVALAGRLGWSQGQKPFSAASDAWLTRRRVGTAPHGSAATLRSELQSGQFHRLGRRLGAPTASAPVVLHAWVVDGSNTDDVVFELEVTEASGKPRIVATQKAGADALEAIFESQALRDAKG